MLQYRTKRPTLGDLPQELFDRFPISAMLPLRKVDKTFDKLVRYNLNTRTSSQLMNLLTQNQQTEALQLIENHYELNGTVLDLFDNAMLFVIDAGGTGIDILLQVMKSASSSIPEIRGDTMYIIEKYLDRTANRKLPLAVTLWEGFKNMEINENKYYRKIHELNEAAPDLFERPPRS